MAAYPKTVAYELMITTEGMLPDLLESARALKPDYILFDGTVSLGLYGRNGF